MLHHTSPQLRHRGVLWFLFACIIVVAVVSTAVMAGWQRVNAAGVTAKGMGISPTRQEFALKAGKTAQGSFRIDNFTKSQMTVRLSVQQFSVKSGSYEYQFSPLEWQWFDLANAEVSLSPNQESKQTFTLTVPNNAKGGGYYFAIFAKTDLQEGSGENSSVQVVSLVSVIVDGPGAIATLALGTVHHKALLIGGDIPYEFDIKNTGNVHATDKFFIDLSGSWQSNASASATHTIFPGTTRRITGKFAAPMLPGIYTLTYGYDNNDPTKSLRGSHTVIYIPPWTIVAAGACAFYMLWLWQQRHTKKRAKRRTSHADASSIDEDE